MAKIFPLSEGVFTVGRDKQFIPFDLNNDELTDRSTGSLLVEVQPFLVVTDKDLIVLDAGLGFSGKDGIMQIHANIAQAGYSYEDVTKVLLSHLHKDHTGGVLQKDANGLVKPTFPNAEYYVYRPEADYALKTGYPSYHPEEIEALLSTAKIHWLDGQSGLIDDYITYTHSGGHCPEHIVYLIDDGSDKVFYGGDEAPQLKQMKMKYVAKYDFDGKKAMALREQYGEEGRREGWKFLFYHDVTTPVAVLS
ncbi:MBL fold metallo-hydrolase [Taibaiella soli]|uniref:MBL fold metallo-hydrolase n=1 Tax=Taibaiella soli TaxID=1649169 RepID=A0A2W2C2A2_9BACT|nr:MBL fold metallo-hydrolase [Taibaiella soli]PZF74213.1 MBL fold metallo-hydrolase [Taibaiella soli]